MHINHHTVIELKKLGHPMPNIRRALMKLTGTRTTDIAPAAGVSKESIQKYIEGRRQKVEIQEVIANHFRVPVGELFSDVNNLAKPL